MRHFSRLVRFALQWRVKAILLYCSQEKSMVASGDTVCTSRGSTITLLGVWEISRFEVDRSCGSKDTEVRHRHTGLSVTGEWPWSHDGASYGLYDVPLVTRREKIGRTPELTLLSDSSASRIQKTRTASGYVLRGEFFYSGRNRT